jgi:hypothetical protein
VIIVQGKGIVKTISVNKKLGLAKYLFVMTWWMV